MSKFNWIWFAIAVFFILFGIFAVTNIEVVWGKPVMGFAALLAGVGALFVAFRGG